MKSEPGVVQRLNLVLKNELTAINQYFLHARMLGNWGITKLEEFEKHESIDEMKHADSLIKRILFLEGLPNLQDLDTLMIGENVSEILQNDLKLEQKGLVDLREAIAHSEAVHDYVSRDLLSSITKDEERHVDFIETQLGLIQKMGLENYVQLESGSADESK